MPPKTLLLGDWRLLLQTGEGEISKSHPHFHPQKYYEGSNPHALHSKLCIQGYCLYLKDLCISASAAILAAEGHFTLPISC